MRSLLTTSVLSLIFCAQSFAQEATPAPTSGTAHADTVAAWAADTLAGHESIIIADTNTNASELSAACQQLLIAHDRVGSQVGTGRAGCALRVGDLVQSRHNTSDIRTSSGRRVLNRDTWIITGNSDTGVTARHTRDHTTVTFSSEYLDSHVELAYAVTIAGAQGRTTDTASGARQLREAMPTIGPTCMARYSTRPTTPRPSVTSRIELCALAYAVPWRA